MADEPHPDARAFIEEMAEGPPLHTLPLSAIREAPPPAEDPEPVAAVTRTAIRGDGHGIPIRVYEPAGGNGPDGGGPFPALVWAHGGGSVLGDLESEDATGRALANAAGCVVVTVDYRLAPEHPFPAGLEDVLAAVEWAGESIDDFGGDPDRVAVGGESAGGKYAAATALLTRDRGGPHVDYQLLVYPSVNYTREFDSYDEYDGYFLTREMNAWFEEQYLAHSLHGHNRYAYPLEASDFSDLPPATVVTAGFDPLRDEGEAYAAELEDAGVPVTRHHYDDMIHAFFGRLGDPEWERAREAVADVGEDLRGHWG